MHWTEKLELMKHRKPLPPSEPRDFGDNNPASPEEAGW